MALTARGGRRTAAQLRPFGGVPLQGGSGIQVRATGGFSSFGKSRRLVSMR